MGYIAFIDKGPKLGCWRHAERYGFDILYDLNAFAVGWTDWNIALDMEGGPNWAKNTVDSPILVDTKDGGTFYKNPMFYYMGHFSKFIKPGAQRIGVVSLASGIHKPMEVTSFFHADTGLITVVVLNREKHAQTYSISLKNDSRGYINVDIPSKTIQTIIFKSEM